MTSMNTQGKFLHKRIAAKLVHCILMKIKKKKVYTNVNILIKDDVERSRCGVVDKTIVLLTRGSWI